MEQALGNIRVVEIGSTVASGVAGMILGDFGADVIKIELETATGVTSGEPGCAAWDRNKRSILGRRQSRDALIASLTHESDVLIIGDVLELPDVFAQRNPRLVVAHLPPYGDKTPWAGGVESHELLAAASGLALRQSSWNDVPVDLVYPHALYIQGLWAATCIIAALVERERSGCGQVVTVDGLHAAVLTSIATFAVDRVDVVKRIPPVGPGGPNPFYSRYRCQDGQWLFLAALLPKFQTRALSVLGLTHLFTADHGEMVETDSPDDRERIRNEISIAIGRRPCDELLGAFDAVDCPACALLGRSEWLDHPQLRETGMRVTVDDPKRGTVVMPGVPLAMSETPGSVRTSAPIAAMHATSLQDASLAWSESRDATRAQSSVARTRARCSVTNTSDGPLSGVRVLDLGTVLAGPLAGSLLAGLGADVVKVEPLSGDAFRTTGFFYNRGMRSVALNLRTDMGRTVFYRLVVAADMVIDNYRPGVLQGIGIDYDSLRKPNPNISSFSITGFGERGPLAGKAGFDPILQSLSGMMIAQGGEDEPVFLTTAVNDVASAVTGVLATCLSVFWKLRGGHGQRSSTSLAAQSAFMQLGELVRFNGRPEARTGSQDFQGPSALDRYYQVADGWVRLQSSTDAIPDLRSVGLLPEKADSSWSDDELRKELSSSFAVVKGQDIVALLTSRGVAAVVARYLYDVVTDNELAAIGLFQRHPAEDGKVVLVPGEFVKFSRTVRSKSLVAPGLGEHTKEVLIEAGLTAEEIDSLVSERVVAIGEPFRLSSVSTYR
jgi:crotonobetainyl-CoA:carnitine CoA-transferase CaiB-like acyl-CoA transferase